MRFIICVLLLGVVSLPLVAQTNPSPAPSTPAPVTLPAQNPSIPPDYIIGPGDSIQVFVWRNPDLSSTVAVRPDGKISTPLNEDMVAIGKTPSQLARDIEKALGEYVRAPQVNVIVNTAVSTFSQVKVVGQVKSPQAIPFRQGLRVIDVVLACGGVNDFAAPNRARIVRQENGKIREIKVKLKDLLNDGDLSQNVELKAGDVFIIPQSRF